MINAEKAIALVHKKYPKRTAVQIIDYSSKRFLVAAVENTETTDLDSPYFAVDKQTGEIRTYSPVDDLERFTAAIQTRATNIA